MKSHSPGLIVFFLTLGLIILIPQVVPPESLPAAVNAFLWILFLFEGIWVFWTYRPREPRHLKQKLGVLDSRIPKVSDKEKKIENELTKNNPLYPR